MLPPGLRENERGKVVPADCRTFSAVWRARCVSCGIFCVRRGAWFGNAPEQNGGGQLAGGSTAMTISEESRIPCVSVTNVGDCV